MQIKLFGQSEVVTLSRDASKPLKGQNALLFAFILQHQRRCDKDTLAHTFYPDSQDPRNSLKVLLRRLRSALPSGVISSSHKEVWIEPELDVWVDVQQFEQTLSKLRLDWFRLSQYDQIDTLLIAKRLQLYRGEFLDGVSAPNIMLDRWLMMQRASLHQQFVMWSERLAQLYISQKSWDSADAIIENALKFEPLHENLCRLKVMALAKGKGGQEAVAYARWYEQQLERELGVAPSEAFQATVDQVKDKHNEFTPTSVIEESSVHQIVGNAGSVFGRDPQVKRLTTALLDRGTRLLSLVGFGGVGKTVLAQEIGHKLQSLFKHGVCFVSFESLPDESNNETAEQKIVTSLFNALQPDEEQDRDIRPKLFAAVQDSELLLVLDNIDPILSGHQLLVDLLYSAPHLRIITTSRLIPPTHTFEGSMVEAVGGLGEAPATHYFVDCAERRFGSVKIKQDEFDDVARICRLVGGIPLALKLATSWLQALSPAQIADRLKHDLRFLDEAPQPIIEQKQILRIVEETWHQLTPQEQEGAAKLSIFAHIFDATSAAQLAGCTLKTVHHLLNRGVLLSHSYGSYQLHPLIRLVASERLSANETWTTETNSAYCLHYEQLMAQYSNRQTEQALLDIIEPQAEDLKNALRKIAVSAEHSDDEKQWFILRVTSYFCQIGRMHECKIILSEMLEHPSLNCTVQGTFHLAMGELVCRLHHDSASIPYLNKAYQLFSCSVTVDLKLVISVLCHLCFLYQKYGHRDESEAQLQQLHDLIEEEEVTPDSHSRIRSTLALFYLFDGQLEEAERELKEALKLIRESGEKREESLIWGNLGQVYLHKEAFVRAEKSILKGLKIAQEINDAVKISNLIHYQIDLDLNWGRFGDDSLRLDLPESQKTLRRIDRQQPSIMHKVRETVIEYESGNVDEAWTHLETLEEMLVLSDDDTDYAYLQLYALKAGLFEGTSYTERSAYLAEALQYALELGNTPVSVLPLCAAAMMGESALPPPLWNSVTQFISTETSAPPFTRKWVRELNPDAPRRPLQKHSYQQEIKPLLQQCLHVMRT